MQVVRNPTPAEKTLNRKAISAGEVATYIKLGRQRVQDSAYDPYVGYKDPTDRMMKDAMIIAQWFNQNRVKWNIVHYLKVHKDIRDIQHGPALYWKKLLQAQLKPSQFKAAEFWALRHKAGEFVDMTLGTEARDAMFTVLDPMLKLRLSMDPYRVMLDFLRFVFHGLVEDDPDNGLQL